jgi:Mg-chelatase subunit ChlD
VGRIEERAVSALLRDDPDEAIALLADMAVATDPALRARARLLAGRLLPRLGAAGPPRQRGSQRLAVHAGTLEGELDLDRTLDRAGARRPRHGSELVTRRFSAAPRAVCLLVDRSGSMGAHAVALAAVAAAAVVAAAGPDRGAAGGSAGGAGSAGGRGSAGGAGFAGGGGAAGGADSAGGGGATGFAAAAASAGGQRLRCGVIAFASETMVLRSLRDPAPAERVIDDLLSLRGHGRTDLAGALRAAARMLQDVPGGRNRQRTALLLSDCLHTRGLDPRAAAGALDCLHVLGTSDAADARGAGIALARRGRGRYLPATNVAELTVSLASALR